MATPLLYPNKLQISEKYHEILGNLEKKIKNDPLFLRQTCTWLKSKLDKKIIAQIEAISEENKCEACLEHIIIALVAGDITAKEIKKLLK